MLLLPSRLAPVILMLFAFLGSARVRAQLIYDTNIVARTFVGSGVAGYLNGTGTNAMLGTPCSIVADSRGNLFVLDSFGQDNALLRKITPEGMVSTVAGGGDTYPTIAGAGVNGTNVDWTYSHYNSGLWRSFDF